MKLFHLTREIESAVTIKLPVNKDTANSHKEGEEIEENLRPEEIEENLRPVLSELYRLP